MEIGQLKNDVLDIRRERDLLKEDISLLKKNQKTREEVIEKLKDENEDLLLERDLYVGYYEDVRRIGANLEKELKAHTQCNDELGRVNKLKEQEIKKLKSENKALRLQADEYFEMWQEAIKE
ncbi:hypothetical protein [Mammaliicoccus sciuri]|uniref:hypothetical protein n=1 Tax=Mammaliicoccus sciuri TaxID=1296 RepID=UPI002B25FE11|nr:hypothetical protein [Mammaliicoccus sciuri]WQK75270.1 hypothetical protein P3U33_05930 [Mammaliicoccus sciuri]